MCLFRHAGPAYRQAGLIRHPEGIENTGFLYEPSASSHRPTKNFGNDSQKNRVYGQTLFRFDKEFDILRWQIVRLCNLSFPLAGNLSSKKDAGQAGMTETVTNLSMQLLWRKIW
jgi:hypothetical protein